MKIFAKLKQVWDHKFSKSLSLKRLSVVALLLTGAGVAAGSTYSIVRNFKLGGDFLDGYVGTIGLNIYHNQKLTTSLATNNTKPNKFRLEGKEYDFANATTLNQGINQAIQALTNFNNSRGIRDFSVTHSNIDLVKNTDATKILNLYFNAPNLGKITNTDPKTSAQTAEVDFNLQNAWFRYVAFNQISIDRYGFDYNENGSSQTTTSPTLHRLVTFNNVGASKARLLNSRINGVDAVAFNIYDQNIAKSEFELLANTNSTFYLIPSQFANTVKNEWNVWLDKDLLAYRLNYIYQTYIFNQPQATSLQQVTRIIGNPNVANGQTEEQKSNYQKITANYYALSNDEKKFAEDYLKIVVNGNVANSNSLADAVDRATKPERFITSDGTTNSIDAIYNNFVTNSGSTTLFNNHLLATIKGGSTGNWTNFFPKYNSRFNQNFQEKLDPTKKEDLAPLYALNGNDEVISKPDNNTSNPSNDNNPSNNANNGSNQTKKIEKFTPSENQFYLSVDSSINRSINNQTLFDRLTKYQIRYFDIRKQAIVQDANTGFQVHNIWSDGVYSSDRISRTLNAIDTKFAPAIAENNVGFINLDTKWTSIIAALIFALVVGIVVAVIYRVPGIVAFLFWLGSVISAGAIFFQLNLTLTTDSAIGAITAILLSVMIMLYGLNNFVKQVKHGNSLKQAANKSFINYFSFAFDILVPVFFTAILFAFTALLELRGFGLYLSIGTFITMFVFVVLSNITNWLLFHLNYVRPNLFLSKANRAYLKSITGELNIQSEFARKFVSKEYFRKRTQNENEGKLFINLFSWKTLVYSIIILIVLVVGISFLFIPSIGFGSSFVLKNGISVNYTIDNLTLLAGKNLNDAKNALSPNVLGQLVGVNFVQDFTSNNNDFFLRTTSSFDPSILTNKFAEFLQPNAYSVAQVSAFNSQLLINADFKLILFSLLIVSVYYAVRFNWSSIFQLWITTFLLIGLSIAMIAIIRISVDRNIIGAILVFYVFGLITNSSLLHVYRENFDKWHLYTRKDFYRLINKAIENNWLFYCLFLFFAVLLSILGAIFNLIEIRNFFIYILISIIGSGLLILPFGTLIWVASMTLRQKFFYNGTVKDEYTILKLKYRIKNRDKFDEELISGINFFPHK
ncbi:Protein export membrane protein SecD/SecF, C-terminal domain-containing protein [[Mycoplasma] cavipharyngis]|uniref:hypothetical protein n=1 Tax=[Mycoplasma] cavipharyngis TaxID=92757 RepID=UPI0037042C1C